MTLTHATRKTLFLFCLNKTHLTNDRENDLCDLGLPRKRQLFTHKRVGTVAHITRPKQLGTGSTLVLLSDDGTRPIGQRRHACRCIRFHGFE
jgi:hypothetical protein